MNKIINKIRGNSILLASSLGLILILIFLVPSIIIDRGIFLSTEQKDDKIMNTYLYQGYTKASDLVEKYYGNSQKGIDWERILIDIEMELINKENSADIVITEKKLVLNGNYHYFDCSVKNNSKKTLSYIEVDIFLYDDNENMIDSTWTNWSGTLPPNGTAKLSTMIDYDSRISKFSAKVSDYSTK
ncbi:MAG: FxLYD domain-containing protein [Anaerorhabdus sp.]|uniref:FxLYD domain-containing protein n=1 Tax=Anaerorhabdus sp. TaxID=1872524 RepID=UPI002FC6F4D3